MVDDKKRVVEEAKIKVEIHVQAGQVQPVGPAQASVALELGTPASRVVAQPLEVLDRRDAHALLEDAVEVPLGQARLLGHLTQALRAGLVVAHKGPDLLHGGLLGHQAQHLGLAALAGPEAVVLGLVGGGVEAHVGPARQPGLARWAAEDFCGAHAVDEEAVGAGVA